MTRLMSLNKELFKTKESSHKKKVEPHCTVSNRKPSSVTFNNEFQRKDTTKKLYEITALNFTSMAQPQNLYNEIVLKADREHVSKPNLYYKNTLADLKGLS